MTPRNCSSFAFSSNPRVTKNFPPPAFAALISGLSKKLTDAWEGSSGLFHLGKEWNHDGFEPSGLLWIERARSWARFLRLFA
jgi:hypothetical protein